MTPERSWRVFVAASLGLLAMCLTTFAQEPRIRASLQAVDPLWAGQKVTLVVELLAPGYFSSAASFDLPDPPGMVLLPPGGSPLVSGETIDDTYYTIQRHELAVYAATAGKHVIPPFRVRFAFKRAPLDHDDVAAVVVTPSLSLNVTAPPGTEGLGQVISARNLRVVEEWKPEPGRVVKVGDAFTRTVTFSAPDVPAMMFPPFPAGKIDGLAVYPKPPEVIDPHDRGAMQAERRDAVTYLCQRPGRFIVPAARLTWFDLDVQQLRTIDFPARTLEVAPNAALKIEDTAAAMRRSVLGWKGAAIVLAALAVLMGVVRARVRLRVWLAALFAPLRPVRLQPLNPVAVTSPPSDVTAPAK